MPEKKKPVVVVTRKLPDVIETRMMELFDTRLNHDDTPPGPSELIEAVKTADVLVPTVTDRIDARLLAQAGPNLRLIASVRHRRGPYRPEDRPPARYHGHQHPRRPDRGHGRYDHGAAARRIAPPDRKASGWSARATGRAGVRPTMLGHRIWGKRLGIVGLGRIGQALAKRARGFGLSIHYHNRRRVHPEIEAELEATYWESLDQMLARMDILSINCPHTPGDVPSAVGTSASASAAALLHRQHVARRSGGRERSDPHAPEGRTGRRRARRVRT